MNQTFTGSPRTQAVCACVCKKWSEVALDELWRDLEHIYPLLKLVIPSELLYEEYYRYEEYGEEKFTREKTLGLLQGADWPRFRQYASRVRFIIMEKNFIKLSRTSNQGLAFIHLQHPFGSCLTPNVRRLRWNPAREAKIAPMIPFISQQLEELRLDILMASPDIREAFLSLAHRTPNLKKLSIESSSSLSDVSSSFSRWIQTCFSLEKAHIPRRWQISSVIAAFGSLPNLFEFGIKWSNFTEPLMELRMDMTILEGHFRSLRRLGWTSRIDQANKLLQQTSHQLQGLALNCPEPSSQEEVVDLVATALTESLDPDDWGLAVPPPFSLETLRPLLACGRLRVLRIHYPSPFNISTMEIEEMGAAWPDMEQLVLCPDPSERRNGTPISSLPHIATAFPRIRALGLYINPWEPPGSAGDLFPEGQFRSLRELNVGTSSVPSGGTPSVGLYLASLFAVGTRPSIKTGVSLVRRGEFFPETGEGDWKEIECLVHLTMAVKEAVLCRVSGH
ncbi:hypothetical protein FRC00_000882 [Tulasnella sp. 408]|nr:hypothetical protein FRC00_000882 [Tulasnella sp. 408]